MNLEALPEIMTDCLLNLKYADSKIDSDSKCLTGARLSFV